jgi:hypothetical protein
VVSGHKSLASDLFGVQTAADSQMLFLDQSFLGSYSIGKEGKLAWKVMESVCTKWIWSLVKDLLISMDTLLNSRLGLACEAHQLLNLINYL